LLFGMPVTTRAQYQLHVSIARRPLLFAMYSQLTIAYNNCLLASYLRYTQ
jgi:hypothetical protein